MIEIGRRARTQPPPPHILVTALRHPDAPGARRWLELRDDEQSPTVAEWADDLVVWTSLWPHRPDARIRFEIASDGGGGSLLTWILLVDAPAPDAAQIGHFRYRLNRLINADLRYSFGN